MPITFPSTPTLNQQHITGGKTWIWNGTNWAASVPAGNISPNVLSISSNVVPAATTTYDLGTDTARWRDLYLAGNTIDLGGTAIKSTVSGVTISSAANANIAVGIAVDTVRLGTGANAITITATNTGLQTINSANVVIPIGGGGSTVTVANTAPLTPSVGSMWLDNDTGDFRVYFGNAWAGIGLGPIGATGPAGTNGATGATGTAGTNGAIGATGASGPGANQLLNTNSSVTFSNLTVSSLISLTATSENITSITGATGTVSHDLSSSTIFFHTSLVGNFTANFVNVPTTNNRVISVVLILQQGATPFICNAVQIDGAAQTVYYINAAAPAGTANRRETQSFSLVRSANAWTVLGTLGSFG